jgi:hypothetical protein
MVHRAFRFQRDLEEGYFFSTFCALFMSPSFS